jgi:hypothetical protein
MMAEVTKTTPTRGMQRKTIVQLTKRKVDEWCSKITDVNLADRVRNNYMLSGGAIANMLMGLEPHDWDFYITDIDVAHDLANYYVNMMHQVENDKVRVDVIKHERRVEVMIKSAGVMADDVDGTQYQYFEGTDGDEAHEYLSNIGQVEQSRWGEYYPILVTSNAISLTNDVQVILRFVGYPEYVHKHFDFVHAKAYYTPETGLVVPAEVMKCLLSKTLKYQGSLFPICAMFRLRKFIKRGWHINAGQMFKIAYDINKLNLDDISVLQEQLTGVDEAYFHEALGILKQEFAEGKPIDATYVFELLDRVFEDD